MHFLFHSKYIWPKQRWIMIKILEISRDFNELWSILHDVWSFRGNCLKDFHIFIIHQRLQELYGTNSTQYNFSRTMKQCFYKTSDWLGSCKYNNDIKKKHFNKHVFKMYINANLLLVCWHKIYEIKYFLAYYFSTDFLVLIAQYAFDLTSVPSLLKVQPTQLTCFFPLYQTFVA